MANSIPTEPMTVLGLHVDNFKRMRAARLHPTPTGLIPVRGRNAQGKSSLIDSMLSALLGGKTVPKEPITVGEHGAQVILDLGEIVIECRWKRDSGGKAKRSLAVTAKDGSSIKSPQAILDNLTGQFADPVAFLEMAPADQVKTVLAVTGLDKTLRELEEEQASYFERRRDLGRDADRLSKTAQSLAAALPLNVPAEIPSTDQLVEELDAANKANQKIESVRTEIENATSTGKMVAEELDETAKEIERLQAKAKALTARRDGLVETWKAKSEELAGLKPIDTVPIRTRIAEAESLQALASQRKASADATEAAADARAEHEAADQELERVRSDIAALLAEAAFPVEGMSYDPEGKRLMVGAIPLDQSSQAERLKIAAGVAMAGSPTIRVMFAREGSLLDASSKEVLAAQAQANGFQLWLEVVDDKREGAGVWIEDGEAFEVGEVIEVEPRTAAGSLD